MAKRISRPLIPDFLRKSASCSRRGGTTAAKNNNRINVDSRRKKVFAYGRSGVPMKTGKAVRKNPRNAAPNGSCCGARIRSEAHDRSTLYSQKGKLPTKNEKAKIPPARDTALVPSFRPRTRTMGT